MLGESGQATLLEQELGDDDLAFLDDLAERISRRRLTTPAIFMLESLKPLNFVGSQVLHFFRPFIQMVWTDPAAYDRAAKLLEHRGSLELLLRRLEAKG